MQVLLTVGLIVVLAAWGTAVHGRLVQMRTTVKEAWKLLEADQTKVAAQNVYNAQVEKYNTALQGFPALLVAPMSGLKPARLFKSEIRDPKSEI